MSRQWMSLLRVAPASKLWLSSCSVWMVSYLSVLMQFWQLEDNLGQGQGKRQQCHHFYKSIAVANHEYCKQHSATTNQLKKCLLQLWSPVALVGRCLWVPYFFLPASGRIRKLKDKLGETLEFRLAFDGELPGSEGGVVVLEKKLLPKVWLARGG